jgi:UDP-N-acetylmuramate dehydrogenase
VADAGFRGLVVRLAGAFDAISIPAEPAGGRRTVRAGGAVRLPVLARRTVTAGLSGLEWAQGVPGSVGGAVRMNAGGHGSDVAATLVAYRWFDLRGPHGGEDDPRRLALGYRTSSLRPSEVVTGADFSLVPGDPVRGERALREIVTWRRRHQPGGANAGSVFANPPGDAAGRLVEEAGLKGKRLGSARVSEKHANFIQADPGGSADDVRRLIDLVGRMVGARFGVQLRPEVHMVGFDDPKETTP